MKFHVGDRWADQWDNPWMVVHHWADRGEIAAINRLGSVVLFDGKTGVDKFAVPRTTLTRLISSERWIPFAEMMPEPPTEGEKRIVVAYVEDEEDPYLFRVRGGQWVASDEIADWSLSELNPDGAHWRYLQPPEASC